MLDRDPHAPRLRFRRLTMRDVPVYHSLLTDPHIRRYMMDGQIVAEDFTRRAIQNSEREWERTGLSVWLLYEGADGPEIGLAGFYRFEGDASPAQLLYAFRESYTGRGYAREATQALVQYARERALLDDVVTNVDEPNRASRRVLERLGFRETGEGLGAFGRVIHYVLPAGRPPLELRTERLLLRPLRESDAGAFAALNADRRVMEFFSSTLSEAESAALATVVREHFAQHGYGVWAMELPHRAPFVGLVGLNHATFTSRFTPCVELAYRIDAAHWGNGYAREGAEAALRVAFGQIGLTEVVAFTAVPNLRSQRVMEKLGMVRDPADDFDHPNLPRGHPLQRHVLYRMSKQRFGGRGS